MQIQTTVPSDSIMPFRQRVDLCRNVDKIPLENLSNLRRALLNMADRLASTDRTFLKHVERKMRQRIESSREAIEEGKGTT